MKKLNSISGLFLFLFLIIFSSLKAQIEPYQWGNVSIGGGGFVLGVYVHPQNPDLIYIRTDVGGAYRWDSDIERMIPLTDWVPYEQSNLYGVYGLTLHPTDQNIVYMSLGKYRNQKSDVYKSTDKGATWEPLHFGLSVFGANHHPNRKGNPLMLNPHNPEQLFVGTIGAGLHIYQDGAWSKSATIPANGVIRSIAIDRENGNNMYVAVTYQTRWGEIGDRNTTGIYRSTDGGETFSLIPGFDRQYDQFSDISLSKDSDKLYVSSLEHDGKTGAVFRLDDPATESTWVNITPETGPFRTVTASPHDNNVVMTARGQYGSLSRFAISTDSGNNWTFKTHFTIRNIVPWHPAAYPGSAISQIEFDPVNPNKIYFSDWYSVYTTDDWTAETVHWYNDVARGHEEIVPARIVGAHPDNDAGAILYVGGADISGVSQLELEEYSTIRNWASLVGSNRLQEVSGIDYCESAPNTVVAMGGQGWGMSNGGIFVSRDGGQTFSATAYTGSGGKVAVSGNDKNNFVAVNNSGHVRYTKDGGASFHNSSGAGTGFGVGDIFSRVDPLASDRVNGNFYLYSRSNGRLMRSINGGETFTHVGTVGSSGSPFINVKTVPGMEGHIWITNGSGLHSSINAGETWNKHPQFSIANYLAIGKPITPDAYPAIYVWGRKTEDTRVYYYRSIDGGVNFEKVNPEPMAGNDPMAMGADMNVFGRFYVATNGRGVHFAQIEPGTYQAPDAPSNLTAVADLSEVILQWEDNSENETGFTIERKRNGDDGWVRVAAKVDANVSTFTDTDVSNGTYQYRVRSFVPGADSEWSNLATVEVTESTTNVRETTDMGLNIFPNPFTNNIEVAFDHSLALPVTIILSDVSGRQVASWNIEAAGNIILELNNLQSGIYLLKIKYGEGIITRKIVKQ
jgi:hypothetical protein